MSMHAFLDPASVVVVGVGRDGGVGRSVFDNLATGGFRGQVFGVNPRGGMAGDRPLLTCLDELPAAADLAVVAVPAAAVPSVIDDLGRHGTKAAIVLSAGFKEAGPAGAALERELLAAAARHGLRVLGPNCLGLIAPACSMNASFAAAPPLAGSLAVISQSGALGTAILDWSRSRDLGLSLFASLGNRADVSEADLLRAVAADGRTRCVAAYLESVADGPAFVAACSEVTRQLPVVVLKVGGSDAGARAVSSHTGSLAGSDVAYDAAFRAAGVLRAADMEELFGVAEALSTQPVPSRPGTAILTNAGGPAVMTTDACERAGVHLAPLESETIEALRGCLPAYAAVYNPVDVLGDADAVRYRDAARILAADPGVHAIILLLTPQAPTQAVETARAVAEIAREAGITLLASFMGGASVEEGRRALRDAGVPEYPYPDRAVQALSAMERRRAVAARPVETDTPPEARRDEVARALDAAQGARSAFLPEDAAREVAAAYGIPIAPSGLARERRDALELAAGMGYPVALKVSSPDILHKTDVGGVVLGLDGPEALANAWDAMMSGVRRRMPDAALRGAVVQRMLPAGREVIVGVNRDPAFGPLVMFGLGGVYVEVLKDVTFRLAPVSKREAARMVAAIRAFGLLRGARGQAPADVDAIADVIWRVGALAHENPRITELDINPLIVADRGGGAIAADIRIGIGG